MSTENRDTSLDPRVNRAGVLATTDPFLGADAMDQWQTYEVFHQKNRGEQHVHVGIVHAPNAEVALLFAKEQFARRMKCVNLWVVRTADVVATGYDDEDMFQPSVDKSYRESYFYKTRERISGYKQEQQATQPDSKTETKPTTEGEQRTKPRIIIGKKKA